MPLLELDTRSISMMLTSIASHSLVPGKFSSVVVPESCFPPSLVIMTAIFVTLLAIMKPRRITAVTISSQFSSRQDPVMALEETQISSTEISGAGPLPCH